LSTHVRTEAVQFVNGLIGLPLGFSRRKRRMNFTVEMLIDRLESIRVKSGRLGEGQWMTVDRRDGFNGTKWAVLDRGLVLNKSGQWEYEPIPSSRDDNFLARCRFDTFGEAYQAALDSKPYVYKESR
jgi:hypothetical protein